MSKITVISYRQLAKIFEKEGFIYRRTKGDHLIYIKKGVIRPLVIPKYQQIPIFIVKNLLRTANISRERYFELLNG